MKTIFIIFVISALTTSLFAQDIIVQRGDSAELFHSFDSAYAYAQDDDYIYLPPRVFSGNKTINKKIHLVGAGGMADSLETHDITRLGHLFLKDGASGSTYTGLNLSGIYPEDSLLNNVIFMDCRISAFNTHLAISNTVNDDLINIKNIGFYRCFIHSSSKFENAKDFRIKNCIVLGGIERINGFEIEHSIFLSPHTGWGAGISIKYFKNCVFRNNIVVISSSDQGGNFFQNNIGIGPIGTQILLPVGETIYNDVFELATWSGSYNSPILTDSTDYRIHSVSVAKNAATNGTDLGVYGGSIPFKHALGRNPTYKLFYINGETNNQGQLPVQIKVKANNN